MTRALWATFVTLAVLVAIALGIALGVGAPDPGAIERAAAATIGLLGLAVGSIALSTAVEAALPAPPRRRRVADEPSDAGAAELASLERWLRMGASTVGDFHAHVRPRLVSLTRSRLARLGVSLSDRDRVVDLLGADGYALVEPGGAPPADRFEPGVSLDRVRQLVDRLEALEHRP